MRAYCGSPGSACRTRHLHPGPFRHGFEGSAQRQRTLFCGCGQDAPPVAGLYRRCYRARSHSRSRFDGHREEILARDGRSRSCGQGTRLASMCITGGRVSTIRLGSSRCALPATPVPIVWLRCAAGCLSSSSCGPSSIRACRSNCSFRPGAPGRWRHEFATGADHHDRSSRVGLGPGACARSRQLEFTQERKPFSKPCAKFRRITGSRD